MTDEELLAEQVAYYRARAPEYDQWWLRAGRYALPGEERDRWQAEIAHLEAAFDEFAPRGDVLELACGTGLWTTRLARFADCLTAVDASPEVIERNRAKLSQSNGAATVDFVEADLFAWEPDRRYDVVFFSFWLSHVPPARFEAFWALVDRALAPGGRVFFIDNQDDASSESGVISAERQLTDGRRFEIVKVWYEPVALTARLRDLGWDVAVTSTGRSFMMGRGGRMVHP